MNRSLGIGAASLSALALLVVTARQAQTQVGSLPAYVRLQSSTPGTAQTGHSNITGTFIAGQFIGGGGGLANVNADLLDGLDSTAFLQAVPNPLSLAGTTNSAIVSATNAGVNGSGVLGITSGLQGSGVYGMSTATSGANYGGLFENLSSSGWAIIGKSLSTNGVQAAIQGECYGTTNAGVLGVAVNSSGANIGVRGVSNSLAGTGVYGQAAGVGVKGESSNGSAGVFGVSSGTAVRGDTSGSNARGVFGNATSPTGDNFGVYGTTVSSTGRGVYGQATDQGSTSFPMGVHGFCWTSTLGYGLFATGDSGATGLKSFRIDHPADPENKYLLHYSSESPFPQNFYSGNVVTDSNGYAWVELPDYFESINTNTKYQLTVLDETDSSDFVWAKVVKKVSGNRFRIRSNKPGIEVSWRVESDRNDLRVKWRRPTDVRAKYAGERGKYQHPEYYGKPARLGMDYDPSTAVNFQGRTSRP